MTWSNDIKLTAGYIEEQAGSEETAMQAAPRFAQRRRALRWLVGGAGGWTLFGCGGGGEVDPQVAESALDATGPGASLFTKVVRGALLNGPPFPKITSADTIVVSDAPAGTVTVSTGKRGSYIDLHLTEPAQ